MSACSLTCTCLDSLAPDEAALARAGFPAAAPQARELCGADLQRLGEALEAAEASGARLVVGCKRKAGFFREALAASGIEAEPGFADVHAQALWSDEAAQAGPKLAALFARESLALPPVATVSYESAGVTLILGAGEAALELARLLQDSLDVTVLLQPGAEATPHPGDAFPVAQGRAAQAEGRLGRFRLTLDDYALASPAARSGFGFGAARDGAVSHCDILVDLTGGAPLFSADALRPGYLRADPRRPGVAAELARKAEALVGRFDKARFVTVDPGLCAHARNRIQGCSNCLDLCPTGAILTGGDVVSVDPHLCAGCGQCAAACPSGAIQHQAPPLASLAEGLRAMLGAWFAAGGERRPVVLFADSAHGLPLIEASARTGRGLAAHVLPFALPEIGRLGPDLLAAALAWGADLAILVAERPKHGLSGLEETLGLMRALTEPMGFSADSLRLIRTDDPEMMEAALREAPAKPRPSSRFFPPEDKRGLLVAALIELNRLAPEPQARIALEKGAPFGAVTVDPEACTLCMACAGACPAQALTDNPETPMLRFTESACLQCGICASTCPEQAIALTPRLDFAMWDAPRRILHEEPPFCCEGCGAGFGTRSGIERVIEKLAGHWMFAGPQAEERLALLKLCESCRVKRAAEAGFAPYR